MGKMIELTASDGHKLAAYRAEPSGKPRGGIVVIQEIFGVNSHIRQVADGYAADGYLAIAPALFDRVQKNVELGGKLLNVSCNAGSSEGCFEAGALMEEGRVAAREGEIESLYNLACEHGHTLACARRALK